MDKKILPSQRANIEYLERSRLFVEGERVVHATAADATVRTWNVPYVNTSLILLGHGTSITQEAARRLAEERVMLAFVGTGGTPIFLGSSSEYAATEHLQAWISGWPDVSKRLSVATFFSSERINFIAFAWQKQGIARHAALDRFDLALKDVVTIESLRGHEGDFVKSTYAHMAIVKGLGWSGRVPQTSEEQDKANKFLDQGNYLAYGLAATVLWALGIPAGLAVNHGKTRAGGLVFDLADVIKDGVILPCAFEAAARNMRAQQFRELTVNKLHELDTLPKLFDVMVGAVEMMRIAE